MKYNKGGPTEWADVCKTDGPICQAAIENLKFESEVEFRVIAENKGNDFEFLLLLKPIRSVKSSF